MSSASSEPDGDLEQINVKVTAAFLEEIDDTWQGRGYNSRSEFIRYVLHDAIDNPTFDRDELIALLLGAQEYREGETLSRDEVLDRYDIDLDGDREE